MRATVRIDKAINSPIRTKKTMHVDILLRHQQHVGTRLMDGNSEMQEYHTMRRGHSQCRRFSLREHKEKMTPVPTEARDRLRREVVMSLLLLGMPGAVGGLVGNNDTAIASVVGTMPEIVSVDRMSDQRSALRRLSVKEQEQVNAVLDELVPKSKAPLMLRLVFHDAATYRIDSKNGGMNGSIQYETSRPENFGLNRGVNVMKQIYERLKAQQVDVSCADVIALAGAHAVKITKGPVIEVEVGRKDADEADPEGRMPVESFTSEEQVKVFGSMGLSSVEMLALLGSHTIGGKGFGDPLTFDNTYYDSLLKKPWENKADKMASMIGLPSDRVLPDDPVLRPIIQDFAKDNEYFFHEFTKAYRKLVTLGVQ